MKESLTRMLGAVSTLLLIGLFVIAAAPVWAGSLEERIKALEEEQRANREELSQLKGDQAQMREDALAAKAKLPTFSYRQGRGMSIWAADRSWGFRTRLRWHHRLQFYPDKDAVAQNEFTQGDLRIRRIYPYFTYYWDKGFYELDYQQNLSGNRSITIQKMEFKILFNKLNPYLPRVTIGPRVSGFFNKHDTNWSSSSGGLFDRSMMQDGSGVGAGTQVNALALDWLNVPMGPGSISLFQVIISGAGLRNQADVSDRVRDAPSWHLATLIEPFKKSKNKWLKGIDIGMSAQLEQLFPTEELAAPDQTENTGRIGAGRDKFQVRSTERERRRFIRVQDRVEGFRWYLTPGLGYRIGPYWFRGSAAWNRAHFECPRSGCAAGDTGGLVKMRMWRIMNEFKLWSPKGMFTGSNKRAGSVLLTYGFERVDMEAQNDRLEQCSSVVRGARCSRAHVYNNNVALWYTVRPGFDVGFEYSQYHTNKIGEDGNELDREETDKRGRSNDWNSIELAIRVEW